MPGFESLCGSPLWDYNQTWNTEHPDFTPCFTSTLLVWVPCALLWLVLPLEILRARHSKNNGTPWCFLNIAKIVFQMLLICLAFGRLICITQYNQKTQFYSIHTLGISSSVIELLTYVWLFLVLLYGRWKGVRVSMIIPLFWLLWFVAEVIQAYSVVFHYTDELSESAKEAEMVIIIITCVTVFVQLILSSFAEPASSFQRLHTDGGVVEDNCAFSKNSIFSILAFSWVNRLMYRGYKNQNTIESLTPLCKDMISKKVTASFDAAYEVNPKVLAVDPIINMSSVSQQTSSSKIRMNISLVKALYMTTWKPVMLGNMTNVLTTAFYFLPPYMLQKMLNFVQSEEVEWHGYLYGVTFCLGVLLSNLANSLTEYFFMVASIQVKSALISALYRKILRINNDTKKNYMAGEIVNLMAIDTQELFEFVIYIPHVWDVPVRLVLTMYFLWQYLGVACLASLAVIGVLTPTSIFLGRFVDKYQDAIMQRKDKRMKQMSEMLNGIKVLKLYAWEKPFMRKVSDTRDEELVALKRSLFIDCFFAFLWIVAPFVICASCFATYLLIDRSRTLNAETAFVSLALFNLLRFPMGIMPDIITRSIKATVSNRRLVKFLTSNEINPEDVGNSPKDGDVISFENVTLSWCKDEQNMLKDINLSVPRGGLVAVVGTVGCGKTSLLCSLLGEMHKIQGNLNIKGTLAYVPQLAWVQNATLQQNIVFTKTLNERRYNKIIAACALKPDLELLPGGDMTEIGEKGINLSGGQKQRVSLARAVYQDADVYLLDDPLSAVDAHVAAHLFKEIVGPTGMLKNKTRLLATHNVSFLSQVDLVVVMSEGTIVERGTYEELIANEGQLSKFLQQHLIKDTTKNEVLEGKKIANRQVSVMSNDSEAPMETEALYRLTEEEEMQTGQVNFRVYTTYFKNMGILIFTATIIVNLLSAGVEVGSGVWLSQWTDGINGLTPLGGIGIYAGLIAAQSVLVYLCYFFLFMGTLKASFHLHSQLLESVMKSPLSFFDTTPTGRILNRFSKDIESADANVPWSLGNFLNTGCWLPGIIIVIAVTSTYLLALMVPMLILYSFILRMYIHTSNHLRRMDSVSRSPVYSNFTETIQGVASIRAYAAEKYFVQRSHQRVDENHKCYYQGQVASRWLDSTLSILACFIVLATTFLAVLEREKMGAGILGLALTYCIELTAGLNWVVRIGAFLESNIVGVERIREYSVLPSEAPWHIEETKPSRFWPDCGSIEIFNYSTRYREGLDPVLKDVNLNIAPGIKVGVVGRTGAGKSSLILSLFRIIEPTNGGILIDGVDISQIGVHDLRSKLTVIPQDPVLFAGNLRMNLDPWEEHTDEAIWTALERSHLKTFVSSLQEGLTHTISEGGENLSAGQRQLVCLARALLRRTKILILDEATASVDLDTDQLIQNTVRDAFSDCTVITIAHRLNTILNCNRVIVFSQGHLVEEGCPDDLLAQPSSHFYSLAKDAGLV